MTEQPKKDVPAFLISCREPDAIELGLPVYDPNIVTKLRPEIFRTQDGHMDEANACLYLSYKMCSEIDRRDMKEWRRLGKAPVSYCMPGGRHRWYKQIDLDDWLREKEDIETSI